MRTRRKIKNRLTIDLDIVNKKPMIKTAILMITRRPMSIGDERRIRN